MPPKDAGKRGIQPSTPLRDGVGPRLAGSARPYPKPVPPPGAKGTMHVKVGDRVRITPQPWSGEEVEQYRDAIGVISLVTPRPEHNKILLGVKFNDQLYRVAFFAEEVELAPAPLTVTIPLETLVDWHEQALSLADSYGAGYGLAENIQAVIDSLANNE